FSFSDPAPSDLYTLSLHDALPIWVADLVFQLYARPIHPEFFDILAVRKIQREDYELTVRITRTGHVITWENRDVHLTEVATAAEDRKSTRLNSSHLVISYAVFCLK